MGTEKHVNLPPKKLLSLAAEPPFCLIPHFTPFYSIFNHPSPFLRSRQKGALHLRRSGFGHKKTRL
jgi:hypothetical protein